MHVLNYLIITTDLWLAITVHRNKLRLREVKGLA